MKPKDVLTINVKGKVFSRYRDEDLVEVPSYITVPEGMNFREECEWLSCDYHNILTLTAKWHEGYQLHPIFMFVCTEHGEKKYIVGWTKVNHKGDKHGRRRKT